MTKQRWPLGGVMAAMMAAAMGCGAHDAADRPVAAVGQAVDDGPLAARPSPVDLGEIPVGSAEAQTVRLVNTGADEVDITSVRSITDFPPDPCRPILIQPCIRPGESTTLTIDCAPTTAGPIGGHVAIDYASGRVSYHLSLPYAGLAY